MGRRRKVRKDDYKPGSMARICKNASRFKPDHDRKTARTLKRNVIDVLLSICGDIATFNISKGELYIDGTVVYGRRQRRTVARKDTGITLAGAYGDEITLWPQSLFNTLLSRLSVEGAKFFGTTNPDSPYHWLKRDFIDRAGSLDMRVFHFLLEDNPNISEQYINALKREYSGLWYKRFIEGLWVQAEGAVLRFLERRSACYR